LLLVHYGEGHATEQAHLAACGRCAARYRRVVEDLELIRNALERMPAAVRVRRPTRVPWGGRIAVAAMLAGVAVLAGVEVRQWRGAQVPVREQWTADDTDTLRFLAQVSNDLSAPNDGQVSLLPPALYRADREEMAVEEGILLGEPGETCADCRVEEENTDEGEGA
jgi:hypothetical protein